MSGNDRLKFWLLLLSLAAAAAYSFWYAFKAWRENRVVGDTPASRIRSAAQGYVELTGHGVMMPKPQNKGPLTSLPCTWWRYKIEERGSIGRSRGWRTIDSGTSEVPFILDDGTGQCMVDPRGAEVFPAAKTVWYGSTSWPEVRLPEGQGFLGKLTDALLAGGRYRYTEYRLQPRETVCALGTYRSGGSGGGGVESYDGAVAELLHEWKQDQKSLLERFDRNHDGVLDDAEWEQARAAARGEVAGRMVVQPQTPGMSVLSKPADGRAFLLSASNGESLARRLRRNAIAGIGACVCSSAALLWMVWHV
ncbi:MAG: GIDE domain-containing protein [Steroidobacteraceae bacterium]